MSIGVAVATLAKGEAGYSQNYLTFEMSFRFGGRRIQRAAPPPPPPTLEPRVMPPPAAPPT